MRWVFGGYYFIKSDTDAQQTIISTPTKANKQNTIKLPANTIRMSKKYKNRGNVLSHLITITRVQGAARKHEKDHFTFLWHDELIYVLGRVRGCHIPTNILRWCHNNDILESYLYVNKHFRWFPMSIEKSIWKVQIKKWLQVICIFH